MPRSGGGRSGGGGRAPARAPPRPAAPAPPPRQPATQQQRPMSTTAAPGQTQAPPQTGRGSGLFGQMASTAAGVAVGSSIGHAVGGWFGGGGGAAQEPQPSQDAYAQPAADPGYYNSQSSAAETQQGGPCAADVKSFTRCMDENQGNMTVCGWYLHQLQACQQAARPY